MGHINAKDCSNSTYLDSQHTGVDVLTITPGATALTRPVRWIRCEEAGTLTITTFAGASATIYFKAGETRFVGATHVTAASSITHIEGIC